MNNTSIAYKTGFGVMAAFMLLASVPLAFVNFGSLLPHYFSAFICAVATIASGPIAGWITVMIRGGMPQGAWWSLVLLTLLSYVPLLIALRFPTIRRGCFITSGAFW